MEKRNPNWEDVAKLLLLCAPKDFKLSLAEDGLTEATVHEWVALYEGDTSRRGLHAFWDMFSLALYYGTKSSWALRKSYPLIESLYVSPEVIYSLVGLTKAEEFDATFRLKDEPCLSGCHTRPLDVVVRDLAA